jgi:hypothetical protein
LLLGVCGAFAQDFRATLQGTISDPSDAVIAGSIATLRNTETGVERRTTGDAYGHYLFQYVPVGNYVLTASAPGFRTVVREGIRLDRFFNTAAFAQPANFTFGNTAARIGSVRSPGMDNWNLSLTKQFSITERFKLNLRASSFNLMNHPVFAAPNTQFGTGNFGRIFSQANTSRQTEPALKLLF